MHVVDELAIRITRLNEENYQLRLVIEQLQKELVESKLPDVVEDDDTI